MSPWTIKAIYTGGLLQPMEPLSFAEGQHVTLAILSERERVEAAVAPLLVPPLSAELIEIPRAAQAQLIAEWDDSLGPLPLLPNGDLDEEAILRELDEATRGLPPLSEELIDERRNGP